MCFHLEVFSLLIVTARLHFQCDAQQIKEAVGAWRFNCIFVECGPYYWVASSGRHVETIVREGERQIGRERRGGGSHNCAFTIDSRALLPYCRCVYGMCLTISNKFILLDGRIKGALVTLPVLHSYCIPDLGIGLHRSFFLFRHSPSILFYCCVCSCFVHGKRQTKVHFFMAAHK